MATSYYPTYKQAYGLYGAASSGGVVVIGTGGSRDIIVTSTSATMDNQIESIAKPTNSGDQLESALIRNADGSAIASPAYVDAVPLGSGLFSCVNYAAAGTYEAGGQLIRIKGTSTTAGSKGPVTVTGGGGTPGKLATPTNFRQTSSTTTTSTLAWNAVANATGYRLLRGGSVQIGVSATAYTGDPGSYQVQALYGPDASLNSDYSAAVQATVNAPTATTFDFTKAGQFSQTIAEYPARNSTAVSPGVRTNASSLSVTLVSPAITNGYTGLRSRLAVYLDNVFYADLTATAAAATVYPVPLPTDGISRVVSFVEGISMPSGQTSYVGTYVTSVTVPAGAAAQLVLPTRKAKRIVGNTDSIIAGDQATNPAHTGTLVQLRNELPAYEVVETGWGGKSLSYTLSSPALVEQEASGAVAYLAGATSKVYLLGLGANDYFGSLLVSTFKSRAASLLDRIRELASDVRIAIVRPIYSAEETGTRSPTYQAYRDALFSLIEGRDDFCTWVDTSTLFTSADISAFYVDGNHLNDAGQLKYAQFLANAVQALPAAIIDPRAQKRFSPSFAYHMLVGQDANGATFAKDGAVDSGGGFTAYAYGQDSIGAAPGPKYIGQFESAGQITNTDRITSLIGLSATKVTDINQLDYAFYFVQNSYIILCRGVVVADGQYPAGAGIVGPIIRVYADRVEFRLPYATNSDVLEYVIPLNQPIAAPTFPLIPHIFLTGPNTKMNNLSVTAANFVPTPA